jgi:hypothetical protein
VEELTWRLQLEKRLRVGIFIFPSIEIYIYIYYSSNPESMMGLSLLCLLSIQTDLEEAKAQEIAKLQEALHAMLVQVEEANSMVIKEREAARKAIEEAPPVIKETPVIIQDTQRVESLTAEVERFKV